MGMRYCGRKISACGRRGRRAFTLVELIVALAILAIMTSIVVPVTIHYVDDARNNADQVYTDDIAKHADSCVIALNSRSEPVNSQTVCAEIKSLYANELPYELGYIPTGEIGSTSDPDLTKVQGLSEGVTSYFIVYINGSALDVYLVKDGVEVTEQHVSRLISA